MFLGLDLGTSSLKALVIDENGNTIISASSPLSVSQPKPLHSEQDPSDWINALHSVMHELSNHACIKNIVAIGLSGQMHGAVLLDKYGHVLRPAILWNDGRSEIECKELENKVETSREITGNLMMPGFTAPKLLWVKKHEPEIFEQIDKVLLPKDYMRFVLSGVFASDMSDASGTMWINTKNRDWDEVLLSATGLTKSHMPKLFEGNQITGHLLPDLTTKWNMTNKVSIVAGGGDNAAGAIGVGITKKGQGMLSLGTSGVYFVVSDHYTAAPEQAVHSFCHALPDTWHLMSVILSAASSVDWFCNSIAKKPVSELFTELENANKHEPVNSSVFFLPYLSGERTPHNDSLAKGVFFGLTHTTTQLDMFKAVLEGVSFALADGVHALHDTGVQANEINIIGGGAQSAYWRQLIADILNQSIIYRSGSETGPALGAARLAMQAVTDNAKYEDIYKAPTITQIHEANTATHQIYKKKHETFRKLYSQLKPLFKDL